jgi:hypothetical protein
MSWDTEVLLWWISMSTIGLMNILSFMGITGKKAILNLVDFFRRTLRLGLRLSLFYSPLWHRSNCHDRQFFSSIFVGRTIATVAELGFIAQWAIVLHLVGEAVRDKKILFVSKIIFPMIFIAEIFSWYASVSNYKYHQIYFWRISLGTSLLLNLIPLNLKNLIKSK